MYIVLALIAGGLALFVPMSMWERYSGWLLGLAFLLLVLVFPAHAETLTGRVIGVTDGDTLKVLDAERVERRWRVKFSCTKPWLPDSPISVIFGF